MLDQPADLPFIVFAGMLTSRTGGDGRDATTMLLLDKATGRTLYQTRRLAAAGRRAIAWRGCPTRRTTKSTVEMAGRSLAATIHRRAPSAGAAGDGRGRVGGGQGVARD